MGITGLIPFLSKSSRRANIKEFGGQTVAIDAYCWLHKGAFSCADKLVMNEPTLMYVSYCQKLVNMLLSHNIKPILVFDGRYLPAKAETEKKRRESRVKNRQRGAELIRAGQVDEGRNFLRRSLDITHEMALNLIKECRNRNIDCIVAPHEADAELAYLNIKNIAQIVITEDSDLLLFGCVRVFFKMDINGNGLLIEKDRLHISLGIRPDSFNIDKFRHMCILSGCDYLPSLPGIGLGKALKFILSTHEENIYEVLPKLPARLKMKSLIVTNEYREAFVEADRTFKYQLVYDPIKRKQVPLNETENENNFVGEKLDEDMAFQLAIGNLDPMSLKPLDSYDPDNAQLVQNGKNVLPHSSIWSMNFTPRVVKQKNSILPVYASTKGITVATRMTPPTMKRPLESDKSPEPQMTKDFLLNIYGSSPNKCQMEKDTNEVPVPDLKVDDSPILFRKMNPFAQQSLSNSSAKKRCLSSSVRFKFDLESDNLVNSRYFSEKENDDNTTPGNESSSEHINCTQESFSWKVGLGDYKKEGESVNFFDTSVTSDELNSELENDTSEIQKKLLKFMFSGKTNQKNGVEGIEMKYPEEENAYQSSNEEKTLVNETSKLRKDFSQDKTVLTPLNNVLTIKNFCTPDRSQGNSDDAHISPYFVQKSAGGISAPEVSSSLRPYIGSTKNLSKKFIRTNASKCDQRKQQSLLTMFGFQSRPKLQSEKF